MQECRSEGDRLAWLVEQHIRPLYNRAGPLWALVDLAISLGSEA